MKVFGTPHTSLILDGIQPHAPTGTMMVRPLDDTGVPLQGEGRRPVEPVGIGSCATQYQAFIRRAVLEAFRYPDVFDTLDGKVHGPRALDLATHRLPVTIPPGEEWALDGSAYSETGGYAYLASPPTLLLLGFREEGGGVLGRMKTGSFMSDPDGTSYAANPDYALDVLLDSRGAATQGHTFSYEGLSLMTLRERLSGRINSMEEMVGAVGDFILPRQFRINGTLQRASESLIVRGTLLATAYRAISNITAADCFLNAPTERETDSILFVSGGNRPSNQWNGSLEISIRPPASREDPLMGLDPEVANLLFVGGNRFGFP